MEYSIYITYKCNLRCPFCYVRERIRLSGTEILTDDMMHQIIKYISKNNSKKRDLVCFYGGEPLMDYRIMEKFIRNTRNLNLFYAVYTNGLLLDNAPLSLLRLLNIIFVSIDGDKKAHEKYRGKGTFQKTINNIKKLKSKLNSFIIGRVTVTEDTNIYKSVRNLLNYVDGVHWQIVNQPEFNNFDKFLNNYKKNIKKLFNFWLSHFRRGRLFNIIPFQAITASLAFNYPKDKLSFRCGAGSVLRIIDIDGNIYWCDEYVGNKKAFIGNVNDNHLNLINKRNIEIFDDCKKCEVGSICLGRCRRCLEEYSTNQIRNYCALTKYLIEIISEKSDEIKKIIRGKNYDLKSFYPASVYDCTEEIP